MLLIWKKKKFEDTKGVITRRKSKKDKQCKRKNNDLQNITQKTEG